MGTSTQIRILFPDGKHAKAAAHVTEDIIKLTLAPPDLPWVPEAEKCASLSCAYLAFRREISDLDLYPGNTALRWLHRDRSEIWIDRCQDISRFLVMEHPWEFFPQLCCAFVMRFPQVPFTAWYRTEMTVSGALQLFRVSYDGKILSVQEKNGMWPIDEENWDGEYTCGYTVSEGTLVSVEKEK